MKLTFDSKRIPGSVTIYKENTREAVAAIIKVQKESPNGKLKKGDYYVLALTANIALSEKLKALPVTPDYKSLKQELIELTQPL